MNYILYLTARNASPGSGAPLMTMGSVTGNY